MTQSSHLAQIDFRFCGHFAVLQPSDQQGNIVS